MPIAPEPYAPFPPRSQPPKNGVCDADERAKESLAARAFGDTAEIGHGAFLGFSKRVVRKGLLYGGTARITEPGPFVMLCPRWKTRPASLIESRTDLLFSLSLFGQTLSSRNEINYWKWD